MQSSEDMNKKNTLLVVAGKVVDRNDESVDKEELVWANLSFIDTLRVKKPNPVALMGTAAKAYFTLYPDNTPADLEREFRQRNFETGLIAVPWRDDPSIAPLVEAGKVVVKHLTFKESGGLNTNDDNDDDDTSLDYYVMYSVRPRALAEEEMLQYCPEGADENLIRLEQAGDLGFKSAKINPTQEGKEKLDAEEEKLSDEDAKARETFAKTNVYLGSDEIEFSHKVQKGEIRLCFRPLCMETEWRNAQEAHPDAKVTLLGIAPTGAAILGLVEGSEIVCPFARIGGNGQFVPLSVQN